MAGDTLIIKPNVHLNAIAVSVDVRSLVYNLPDGLTATVTGDDP